MIDGKKVPWIIVTNEERVVVEDHATEFENMSAQQAKVDEFLKSRAISYSRDPEGRVVIHHVPMREQIILAFLDGRELPEQTPDTVRALVPVLAEELASAKATDCTTCDLNKIKAKFRERLLPMLEGIQG